MFVQNRLQLNRLSRDFRNQLNKQLHSRNSSPAILISPGLLSGRSPKHLRTVIIIFTKAVGEEVLMPEGSGQREPSRSGGGQHLILRCFSAQRSPVSAYLKVHPETLWPWDAHPLRGVQTLPVSSLFQDLVLTAQLDREWLIVLPHLRMGIREACSTAAFEV